MEYGRVPSDIAQGCPSSSREEKVANVHIAQQFTPLLQSSSDTSPQYSSFVSYTPQHRSWLKKVGYYGLLILLLGTFSILLAVIFITFLWKGVNAAEFWSGDNLSSLWRSIVVSGWATRAVTLSSLVTRLAVAAQAGVCTSMFAALALEKIGLSLHVAPQVSLIRSSNTGPHHLASVLFGGSLTKRIVYIMIPVLVIMITSLISQFSSTILLSDVEPGAIIGSRNTTIVPFGMLYSDNTPEYQGNNYWATRPAFYPAFAEYSEPPSQNAFWYDTNITQRALLPFSTLAVRNALKDYSGMAKVLDVRTACVRPWLTASLVGAYYVPQLTGHINTRLPGLLDEPDGYYYTGIGVVDADFNCTLPLHWSREYVKDISTRSLKEWPVSLCRIFTTNDSYVYGGAFLVVNTTNGTSGEVPYKAKTYNRTHTSAGEGPWLNVDFPNTNVGVALSLCFATAVGDSAYVHITSQTSHQEPTLGWDIRSGDFDSRSIRRQLGVLPGTQASLQERGVLELDPKIDSTKNGSNKTIEFERMVVDRTFKGNQSAGMCTYCTFTEDTGSEMAFWAHRDQVALFQDILVTTKNPALALQAHYFTLLQMAYYDFLTVADVTTDAQLVFYEESLMPRSWRGYTVFVSVILCHLLCVLLAVVLFSTLTKLSRLGNCWQSIGQVVTAETESLLESSTAMSDSEVRKRIVSDDRSTNEPSATFKIKEINLAGRIGLIRQAEA